MRACAHARACARVCETQLQLQCWDYVGHHKSNACLSMYLSNEQKAWILKKIKSKFRSLHYACFTSICNKSSHQRTRWTREWKRVPDDRWNCKTKIQRPGISTPRRERVKGRWSHLPYWQVPDTWHWMKNCLEHKFPDRRHWRVFGRIKNCLEQRVERVL